MTGKAPPGTFTETPHSRVWGTADRQPVQLQQRRARSRRARARARRVHHHIITTSDVISHPVFFVIPHSFPHWGHRAADPPPKKKPSVTPWNFCLRGPAQQRCFRNVFRTYSRSFQCLLRRPDRRRGAGVRPFFGISHMCLKVRIFC